MRLSDLTKKTRTITVSLSDESATVEYRLHAVTPGFLQELRKEHDDVLSVVRQVEQVVLHWDVVDDDGKEIPATSKAILEHAIPLEFLTLVLNSITEDMQAGRNEKNA